MLLEWDDIARSAVPGVDRSGVLFQWDRRLFRVFSGEHAQIIRELLDDPELEKLFEIGLVRFWESDIEVGGCDLTVEVECVPVVSYVAEWPTRMLKEAALLTARLSLALAERDLLLHDAHPWNVLFDGTRPVFVDLGSIISGREVRAGWWWEFRREFLAPLLLHSLGLHALADDVIREHRRVGAKRRWDSRLARALFVPSFWARFVAYRSSPRKATGWLVRRISRFDSRGRKMAWSDYDQREVEIGKTTSYDQKKSSVDAFLRELQPGRVLDFGANTGWFSRLAASHGNTVLATDLDDQALGVLYDRARQENLPVTPLRIDPVWPSGSYGMGLSYPDALRRLKSDTVMAVAVLHHLARNQSVSFDFFARLLDRLARRAAIVEFIPREDEHVSRWPLATEPWYDKDKLVEAMHPFFPRVEELPSSPAPRVMLLFRRSAP